MIHKVCTIDLEIPMDTEQRRIHDWVNLPEDTGTLSLWNTLHDGDLLAVESDLLARTVTLKFAVGYLRTFHQLPEQTEFVLTITGVESVRLIGSVKWPEEFRVPKGLSREEESKLVADYQANWREESLPWSNFEAMATSGAEVLNATLALGDNALALQIGVMSERDSYFEAFIRGRAVSFSVADKTMTSEEFLALGEAYWTAFANRKVTSPSGS
jgi:hypothetical protein